MYVTPEDGSVYIEVLVKVFEEYACSEDILSLMTLVVIYIIWLSILNPMLINTSISQNGLVMPEDSI